MGIVKDILKKRTENRARLEKEAPNLYNGFNELMKHYYKHDVLDFLLDFCTLKTDTPNSQNCRGTTLS